MFGGRKQKSLITSALTDAKTRVATDVLISRKKNMNLLLLWFGEFPAGRGERFAFRIS